MPVDWLSMMLLFMCLTVALYLPSEPVHSDEEHNWPAQITQLKPMCLETQLVANGVAQAVILLPRETRYDRAANLLRAVMRDQTGCELPMLRDQSDLATVLSKSHVIALGNAYTNPFIRELYYQWYTLIDLEHPGAGGHVVQSLHNPLATGKNALLLGGSDDEGVIAATQAFIRRLAESKERGSRSVSVGWVLEVKLGAGLTPPRPGETVNAWTDGQGYNNAGYFGWNPLSHALTLYLMTGDPVYVADFKRLAFPTGEPDPRLNGCEIEDTARPIETASHYRSHILYLIWDLVEESPLFTDEERLKITNALLRHQTSNAGSGVYFQGIDGAKGGNIERHGEYTALCVLCGSRYFRKYYPARCWQYREEQVRNYFSGWTGGLTPWGEDTMWWRLSYTEPVLDYMLLSGDHRPLTSGSLVHGMDQIFVWYTRGRLLYLREFDSRYPIKFVSLSAANRMATLTGDGKYTWLASETGLDQNIFRIGQSYWSGIPPRDPKEYHEHTAAVQPLLGQKPLSEEGFHYVSLRSGFGDEDHYLLLDGYDGWYGRHAPQHLALIELRQRGATVVTGDMNRVEVRVNGMSSISPPTLGRLLAAARHPGFGYVKARSDDMLDCEWDRHLFWRENRYVAVFDDITAQKEGTYEVAVHWQLPGAASWKGRRLSAPTANNLTACVTTAEDRPMPTSINPLKARENLLTRSLLLASDGAANTQYDILPLGRRTAAVSGDEQAIFGLDGYTGSGLSVKAPAFFFSATDVWLQGSGELHCGGFQLQVSQGVSVAFSFQARQLTLHADRPGSVTLTAAATAKAKVDGTGRGSAAPATVKSGRDGRLIVSVPAGSWTVANVTATSSDGIGQAISAIVAESGQGAPTELRKPAAPDVSALQPEWQWKTTSAVTAMQAFTDDAGHEGVLVGTQAGKVWFVAGGQSVWEFDSGLRAQVECFALAQRNNASVLLAGCADRLTALDGAGRSLWQHQCEAVDKAKVHPWSKTPDVRALLVDGLDGDGQQKVVLRNAWGNIERLSLDGKLEGRYVADSYIGANSHSLAVADFLPDAGKEIIAPLIPAWHGPYDQVHDAKLTKLLIPWTFHSDSAGEAKRGTPHQWLTEGHDRVRVLDLDGDGRREYLCTRVGQWNQLKAYDLESQDDYTLGKAKCLWAHSFGAGGRPTSLLVEPLEGATELSVIASTSDGWALAYDNKGRWRWSVAIRGGVSAVAPLRSETGTCTGLLATTSAGEVWRISAGGRLTARFQGEGNPCQVAWLEAKPGGRLCFVGTVAGAVYAFGMR